MELDNGWQKVQAEEREMPDREPMYLTLPPGLAPAPSSSPTIQESLLESLLEQHQVGSLLKESLENSQVEGDTGRRASGYQPVSASPSPDVSAQLTHWICQNPGCEWSYAMKPQPPTNDTCGNCWSRKAETPLSPPAVPPGPPILYAPLSGLEAGIAPMFPPWGAGVNPYAEPFATPALSPVDPAQEKSPLSCPSRHAPNGCSSNAAPTSIPRGEPKLDFTRTDGPPPPRSDAPGYLPGQPRLCGDLSQGADAATTLSLSEGLPASLNENWVVWKEWKLSIDKIRKKDKQMISDTFELQHEGGPRKFRLLFTKEMRNSRNQVMKGVCPSYITLEQRKYVQGIFWLQCNEANQCDDLWVRWKITVRLSQDTSSGETKGPARHNFGKKNGPGKKSSLPEHDCIWQFLVKDEAGKERKEICVVLWRDTSLSDPDAKDMLRQDIVNSVEGLIREDSAGQE